MQITQFTQDLPVSDNFKAIVLNQIPLIDVRAPIEFSQGAFEHSANLPLMNDEERQKVGICYKQNGNATAVKLGHKLVSGEVKEARVQAWMDFIQTNPHAMLYCFRGGMRSKISQQWLADNGVNIVRLKGGYKAFRRYLIDFLDAVPTHFQQQQIQPFVLAGRTGSGKTLLLEKLQHSIDLEGIAHHRGSAFGRHATPQPTQIDFENNLAMALIRFMEQQPSHLIIEDEGRNIGSVNFSKPLFEFLKSGERIVLETPLEERIAITLDEYVVQAQGEYDFIEAWQSFMQAAFGRIQKRLGGERFKRISAQFDNALAEQINQGTFTAHETWIKTLLTEYYDPMYDYQMQKHQHKVSFQASMDDIINYFENFNHSL